MIEHAWMPPGLRVVAVFMRGAAGKVAIPAFAKPAAYILRQVPRLMPRQRRLAMGALWLPGPTLKIPSQPRGPTDR